MTLVANLELFSISIAKATNLKIFVGNLSPAVNDAQLEQLFATFGAVHSAQVVTDRFSGASRGFGFVEMSDADAASAIQKLDNSDFEGGLIRVNEARPKEAGGGRGGFGGGGGRGPGGGGGRGGYGGGGGGRGPGGGGGRGGFSGGRGRGR